MAREEEDKAQKVARQEQEVAKEVARQDKEVAKEVSEVEREVAEGVIEPAAEEQESSGSIEHGSVPYFRWLSRAFCWSLPLVSCSLAFAFVNILLFGIFLSFSLALFLSCSLAIG